MMRSFYRLALSTLIAVFVLILVGGIVRSTGSGMGCPDWPRCFGSWVPPTHVSQLPDNYKAIYSEYRHKKNVKFARYLRVLGMSSTADQLMADESILLEADFNPTKTWIEYVNRLVGVVIGFLIFLVAVFSFRLRKTHPGITAISVITFVLVGFQGWIGSVVVSTNLTPWTITVHMFLALVIVAMLVYLVHKTAQGGTVSQPTTYWWLVVAMITLLVQILLGTQVREAIDAVASEWARTAWVDHLGLPFLLHRSFSWVVLLVHVGLIVNLRKTALPKAFQLTLILLILGTILSGTAMAYAGVPPFLQPVHLLLATVTFGIQFLLFLKVSRKENVMLNTTR